FDAQRVVAFTQINIAKVAGGGLLAPGINDQMPIYIDTDAIIHRGIEAIGTGLEVTGACPVGAELIVADAIARATARPIKVDAAILTGKGRRTFEIFIVEVGATPAIDWRLWLRLGWWLLGATILPRHI